MSEIKCFMVEQTGEVVIQLRRYHSSGEMDGCSVHPYKYHNATIDIYRQKAERDEKNYYRLLHTNKHDPRWPKSCVCGYVFLDDDIWQTNQIELFRNVETGEEYIGPSHKLPVGAMWYNDIIDWSWHFPDDDGKILYMMTPGGEWVIDGRASNGPRDAAGWTRTGIPPLVVARPSIQLGLYHGWLGGANGSHPGYLVDC